MSTATTATSTAKTTNPNPNISVADMQAYTVKKTNLFKFTIALCAIYGVLSLIMLMISLFTAKGNQIFTEEIRPFTITFAGGTIFILILLILQIYSFKPVSLTVSSYDRDICPDFWTLTGTPKNDPVLANAKLQIPNKTGLFQYQCVPNSSIYNMYQGTTAGSMTNAYGQTIAGSVGSQYTLKTLNTTNLQSTDPRVKLVGSDGLSGVMTGLTNAGVINYGTSNLQCDKIFPNYLANQNASDTDIQGTPNALACAYASACGIPWTNVCGE